VIRRTPHASHWGSFTAETEDGRMVGATPHVDDPDPSPLLGNVVDAAHHRSRVAAPTFRRGWLERGPGADARRGADQWVVLPWEEAEERLAAELRRVVDRHGPAAIYAGSYGWASAGRFHHSQSQLRRFTNLLGPVTVSVGSYSTGASEVILPHVVGSADDVFRRATEWPVLAQHCDLLVCFGGLPAKNASVAPGGVTHHAVGTHLRAGRDRGMAVVSISPLADDVPGDVGATWVPIRPGSDVAAMLAMAQVLVADGSADLAFCRRYCTGTEQFLAYLDGRADGVVKDPSWAEDRCGIPAGLLRDLARRLVAGRTMITTSWSLQRSEHGEQPVWTSIALAALVGQIGLPGGGFGHGYSSLADIGGPLDDVAVPAVPGAIRTLDSWIPVARVGDLLLDPGGTYEFNGTTRRYPDIRLVYWVGGNPFHHHQDLNRLRVGLRRMDTVVVHEPYWTAMARHADIVLPATVTLERDDLGAGRNDGYLIAMHRALEPYGQARDDFAIFAGLADRLGTGQAFRQDRGVTDWLRLLYARVERRMADLGLEAPSFDRFWADGELRLPRRPGGRVFLEEFRADPDAHPLHTPSGRIELYSSTIAGFGYDDCPPHPTWLEPQEWPGSARARSFPLLLVANNPATRLHSQGDVGRHSQDSKVQGREPLRMHPGDAGRRGLVEGDVVRVWNDRGACLAGVVVTEAVSAGVVQLSTGAWFDPDDPEAGRPLCVHGNPNVLTADRGTSRLAQGCTGQHVLVEVVRHQGPLPPVRAHEPAVPSAS
jgi:biotin/methionine sulfoxide reductase